MENVFELQPDPQADFLRQEEETHLENFSRMEEIGRYD